MDINDLPDPAPLHTHLVELYYGACADEAAREDYDDTLKQYTTAVMLASTAAILSLLDIDIEDMRIVQLTEEQRDALVRSGTLDQYLDGKDKTDD